MGKNVVLVLIICIIAGVVIYSLSVKEQQPSEPASTSIIPAQITETIEKAETQAKSLAQDAQTAVKEVTAQVEEQIQPPAQPEVPVEVPAEVPAEAAAEVSAQAGDIQAKVQELLAQAQAALNEGKFQDAINVANNILSNFDANSVDAKNIIEVATQKLQEAAQQKAGDLMQNLPAMGQ